MTPVSNTPNSGSVEVAIRRARPDDADALARLRYAFRLERKPALESHDAFVARCVEWMRPRLREDSHWAVIVAERGSRIVGHVWVQIVEKIPNPGPESEVHGYISNFFITPPERNAGIGVRMLHSVLEHCRTSAVDTVFLWPSDRSRPFYERAGFHASEDLYVLELRQGKGR